MRLIDIVLTPDVLIWVLACVLMSLAIGAVIGRGFALRNLSQRVRREREQVVVALQTLLQNTEQLTSDVDSHNSELASMEQSVQGMSATGDLESVQKALLCQITEVVQSNKRMEDDLVMTHFRLEQQAQELDRTRLEARTDELSGLANRKSFDERLKFVLSQYNRLGTPFALLLADVDHFKRINDTHGHHAGDRVVGCLGDTLQQLTRENDHVARFGGDEFALILAGADVENARRAAARILTAVERANFDVGNDGASIAVTLSLGMAFPDTTADTVEGIFQRADEALYRSKKGGRNQLHVWEPSEENEGETQLLDESVDQLAAVGEDQSTLLDQSNLEEEQVEANLLAEADELADELQESTQTPPAVKVTSRPSTEYAR